MTPVNYRLPTCYCEEGRKFELEEFAEENLRARLNTKIGPFFVCKVNRELAGVVITKYDAGLLWIDWVVTREKFLRKGIAKTLVELAIYQAEKAGCHKAWCDTVTGNITSLRFFQALGFSTAVTLRNHWYNQDFVLLIRDIAK